MGTRSTVAVPEGDSWRGRYVHWDGYPSGVGGALQHIRAELYPDDLDGMVKMLTVDHWYWSTLDGAGQLSDIDKDDPRWVPVPDVGVAGNEQQASPDEWVKPEDDYGCEWAYVLTPAGIVVFEATLEGGGHATGWFGSNPDVRWKYRATVAWDDREAMTVLDVS